ncbi:hypothetical protein [Salarchaeum sp. JOR-1]|uniref:hypothetical protein n=1 Tax=Salarchaeum sp. JOR-1 TaxID=2599399 RepID=UPI001198B5AC|nr:hypothetical protein [Salarchaeum sp. JOR-1]QDX41610.1 hypothetical protein FQU85_12100 [Salarchaeum sp. JOR-1]
MSADSMPPPNPVHEPGKTAYAKVRAAALTGVAVAGDDTDGRSPNERSLTGSDMADALADDE